MSGKNPSAWLTLICTEITVIIIRNNYSKTQANKYRNNYSEAQDHVREGLFDPVQ